MNQKIKIDLLNENLSKLRYFHSGGNKHDKFIKYLVLKTLIDLTDIDRVIEISNTFNFIYSENNRNLIYPIPKKCIMNI